MFDVLSRYTAAVTEHPDAAPRVPRRTPGRADGIRARNRASIASDLREVARRQLGEVGPAALSLRAVARDMGMVPSALFRYVSGRDELLTLLIVDAYTSLGDAVDREHALVDPTDFHGRWRAIAGAMRTWALAHPHEWALLYGSPVPTYHAPGERTNDAGTRVARLLIMLGVDAVRAGTAAHAPFGPADDALDLAERATGTLREDPEQVTGGLPAVPLANGLTAWTMLVGAVSGEVFEQLGGDTIADRGAYFDYQMAAAAVILFGRGG